jgi:hypothetical protein
LQVIFTSSFVGVNQLSRVEYSANIIRSQQIQCAIVCTNMPWIRVVLAALAGGIVASMTDWLFMGDWLYKRYDRHPEIWRVTGQTETKAIIWASLLPFLTCFVFALTCECLHLHSFSATFLLALAVWLIAALPLLVANALFIKTGPAITTSYALGWLVKLIIAGLATTLIVR